MYRIWVHVYKNGQLVGASMSVKEYVRAGNARRAAERMYINHDDISFEYEIAERNPWWSDATTK